MDNDGEFQIGIDQGIAGVTLEIFEEGQDPRVALAAMTATTNTDGIYVFDTLFAGDYVIHVPIEQFESERPMDGLQPLGTEPGFEPLNEGVTYASMLLNPNDQPINEGGDKYDGQLDDDNVNESGDLGFQYQRVSIGNLVFLDQDEDGRFEEGVDSELEGITVQLYESGTCI